MRPSVCLFEWTFNQVTAEVCTMISAILLLWWHVMVWYSPHCYLPISFSQEWACQWLFLDWHLLQPPLLWTMVWWRPLLWDGWHGNGIAVILIVTVTPRTASGKSDGWGEIFGCNYIKIKAIFRPGNYAVYCNICTHQHDMKLCSEYSTFTSTLWLYLFLLSILQYRPKVWTHLLIQRVFFIFMTMKIVDSHWRHQNYELTHVELYT